MTDAEKIRQLEEELREARAEIEISSSEGDFRYQLMILVLSLLARDELPVGRIDRVIEEALAKMLAGQASEGGNIFESLLRELPDLDRMMNARVRRCIDAFEAAYCKWNTTETSP